MTDRMVAVQVTSVPYVGQTASILSIIVCIIQSSGQGFQNLCIVLDGRVILSYFILNNQNLRALRAQNFQAVLGLHKKPCQDSTCPPSLFLESWRTLRFLMNLEVVSDDRYHPSEAFVEVTSLSNIRNPVKTLPVLQDSRRFLMNREVVSYDRDQHSEASVKVSSRSNSRNPVKTPPVLQVSSWSLRGHGDS